MKACVVLIERPCTPDRTTRCSRARRGHHLCTHDRLVGVLHPAACDLTAAAACAAEGRPRFPRRARAVHGVGDVFCLLLAPHTRPGAQAVTARVSAFPVHVTCST
eukprot:6214233-Pleurochrysis_carterae.AAC.3